MSPKKLEKRYTLSSGEKMLRRQFYDNLLEWKKNHQKNRIMYQWIWKKYIENDEKKIENIMTIKEWKDVKEWNWREKNH